MIAGTEPAPRPLNDRLPLGDLDARPGRPFGAVPSDLAIDLSDPVGPQGVTDVLAGCLVDVAGRHVDQALLWAAPVGDRIAALVAIASIGHAEPFSVPLRCPMATCGDDLEVELTWDEIALVARRASRDPFEVRARGIAYRIRRPTGLDQVRWGTQLASARDALADLIEAGPVEGLTPARMARLEGALDDHDPLVSFGLDVVCPTCGEATRHEPSLVSIAAARFRRIQAQLVDDIHDLARAYGWGEAEILRIPPWRRARYRALIAAGF
jgi:hypothetical protein